MSMPQKDKKETAFATGVMDNLTRALLDAIQKQTEHLAKQSEHLVKQNENVAKHNKNFAKQIEHLRRHIEETRQITDSENRKRTAEIEVLNKNISKLQ
jgi:predicted RNase H-like nuclease (RuvC/YqgF family)